MKTLGEIFEIGSGGTPSKTHPEYYDGNIPWVKTGDLKDEYLYSVEDCISEEGLNNSSAKMYPSGTVLIAMYGVTIGATSILKFDACTNQACAAFKPCEEVLPEYLYFFLRSKKQKFISDGVGGAQPNISAGYLKKVSIDVRNIKEQEKIVTVLDKLNGIIQKRQKEIDELDELIKARFVEMFGDPISNDKGWNTDPLTAVCSRIYGGGTPSKSHPEYYEGSIPWVSPKDMKSDVITDSIDHITKKAIANSTTNLVPEGSVLMVIRSGILKHDLPVSINAVPVTINQDMKAFVPGENITASFLRNYFKAIELDVLAGVRGVTADNIDFKAFQQRKIIVPPIHLQEEFEDFCRQVDKSKVA